MPRSNEGAAGRTLSGGRAYYTGKNAYASQGFENDTRVSKLPALALLYRFGDQAIPGGSVDTTVQFVPTYASATFNPIYTRGLNFNPNDFNLYCQATGTYRFDASIRAKSLASKASAVMKLKVRRGNNERQFAQGVINVDVTNANDFSVSLSGYIDLMSGDYAFLTVSSGSAFTLAGSTTSVSALGGLEEDIQPTYLHLYQIDLT